MQPDMSNAVAALRIADRRPKQQRAANERAQQIAPSHVRMFPAPQEILLRVEQLSLAVVCPAHWCSPDGLLALMGSAN